METKKFLNHKVWQSEHHTAELNLFFLETKVFEPLGFENLKAKTLWKTLFWTTMACRHALDHMVMDLRVSDENCRQHKTLSAETMLGKITDLAAMCPPGSQCSILPRFFQRFWKPSVTRAVSKRMPAEAPGCTKTAVRMDVHVLPKGQLGGKNTFSEQALCFFRFRNP